jgi:hypothetical protein
MVHLGDKVLPGVWSVGRGRTGGSFATPQNNVKQMGGLFLSETTLVSFRNFPRRFPFPIYVRILYLPRDAHGLRILQSSL